MKKINRFNKIFIILVAGMFLFGCKKKDRLTASTFTFGVTPPAAAVLTGGTVTLTAVTNNPADVTWTVSPSTAGSLNTSAGPSVVFTGASEVGNAVVFATLGDTVARVDIGVVSYIPSPNSSTVFDVYTDNGLPPPPFDSDIDTNMSTNLRELSDSDAPEGFKYLHALNASTLNFWDVTLDDGGNTLHKDLTGFTSLKFFIRLDEPLTVASGEHLKVQVRDNNNRLAESLSNSGDWQGFDPLLVGGWQQVTINRTDFNNVTLATNYTIIEVPFIITPGNLSVLNTLTFDIDAVRWQ